MTDDRTKFIPEVEVIELSDASESSFQYVVKGHVTDEEFKAIFISYAQREWGFKEDEATEDVESMNLARGHMVLVRDAGEEWSDREFVWKECPEDTEGAFPVTYSDWQ